MVVLLSLPLLISSLSSSPYFFSLFLSLFLLSLPLLISSFHLSFSSEASFYFDEISLFLVYLTVFVLFISLFYAPSSPITSFILTLIFIPCVFVFSTSNYFYLYIFYEFSLIPILYIILNWGSYPERSVSAFMLLIYTSVFSLPLLVYLFSLLDTLGSLSFLLIYVSNPTILFTFIAFLAFSVNLPIYGLHHWLPMAHVEAPTFGSMILAGVLLNLGGVGLYRFSSLLDLFILKYYMLSYFLFFLFVATLICCFQSDFNRLVAYSSISHIIALPLILISNQAFFCKSFLSVMFFHGLSSPVMFMLVGVTYSLFSSRQLILMRGLILISPLLSLVLILSFFFTLSAPPYPSFFSEVLFLLSSFSLTFYSLIFFLFFLFFSLVYNLNWLSSILFSSASSSSLTFTFNYSNFFPVVICHFLSFLALFLLSSF